MRVIVAGGLKQGVLLDTDKATAILITDDEGNPNVIFKMMDNGKGWIRLTEGEDKGFRQEAKDLGLI